jgi:hypothetical protein
MRVRLFLLLLLSVGVHLHGDFVLVGGSGFPKNEISATTLKRLFLGHLSFLEGERITLHQIEGDSLKSFCEKHLKVSLTNYERRWARRIFTGKGRVPRTFKDEGSMLKSLLEQEHGLGFVNRSTTLPEGVRVINIIQGD